MNNQKIVVIDYGLGNLFSVKHALEACGSREVIISQSADEILTADRIILPGVGAFADGMKGLHERELVDVILNYAKSGRPLMGICLGMQMLATKSDEYGETNGLDLIPGHVRPIPNKSTDGSLLKIPNIGWCSLYNSASAKWENSILKSTTIGEEVYMVHSYKFDTASESHLLAHSLYGGHKIAAVIRKNNIYGCQFHPEKSGNVGLRILTTFLNFEFDSGL